MIPYQNPDIFIGSTRIQEPITVLTDLIFCGVCFYAYFKTKGISSIRAIKLYNLFFLATGFSTMVAAIIGHAFLYHFGQDAKIYGWVLGVFAISFAQFAALYHTKSLLGNQVFKKLFIAFCIEIVLSLIAVFYFWTFIIVIIHTAIALLVVVTTLEYKKYKKTKSQLSKYMMIGVGILILAILSHVLKIDISKWFNHLDLSHVFMTISMYTMYYGVSNFKIIK